MASVAVIMADPNQSEERLKHESVALRTEIDKGSMYDETVGSSGALQKVLSLVSKVAPTVATVLIVRVIAATNRNLPMAIQAGTFRRKRSHGQTAEKGGARQ
jgi:transcriptional regulator with GAF, ATPase, and Fis domain